MSYESIPAGMTEVEAALSLFRFAPVLVVEVGGLHLSNATICGESAHYLPRLLDAGQIRRGTAPLDSEDAPTIELGRLHVDNGDGTLSDLEDLEGEAVTVRVGAQRRYNGQRMPVSMFRTSGSAWLRQVVRAGDGVLELDIAYSSKDLEALVPSGSYLGLGSGLRVESAGYLTAASSSDLDVTGACSLLAFVTLDEPGAVYFLLRRDAGASLGYALLVDSTGRLGFGATTDRVWSAADTVPWGTMCMLAAVVDAAGAVTLYLATKPSDVASVGTGTVTPIAATTGSLSFMTQGLAGTAWDLRIYSEALSESDLITHFRPAATSAHTVGVDRWRFEDGSGDTAFSDLQRSDLTINGGTHSWVASDTGDDVGFYDGSVSGQSVAGALGRKIFNASPPLVSRNGKRFDCGSIHQMLRARAGGAPLYPRFDYTVEDLGDVTIEGKVITGTAPFDASSLVPRLVDPSVAGQDIEITAPSVNAGTYEVVEVSEDGLSVTVDASLTTETVPKSVDIKTPDADWGYEVDGNILVTRSDPADLVTCDYLAASDGTVSTLWAAQGRTLDASSMTFDPECGIFLPATSEPLQRYQLLWRLAASSMALWSFGATGEDALATFVRPTSAAATFEVGEGRILSVEDLGTTSPASEVRIGYQPNNTIQTGFDGTLVGYTDRNRWAREYEHFPRPTAWTTTESVLTWQTAIDNPGDAAKAAEILAGWVEYRARILRIVVDDDQLGALGEVGLFTFGDAHVGLSGTPAMVIDGEEDLVDGVTVLEVRT